MNGGGEVTAHEVPPEPIGSVECGAGMDPSRGAFIGERSEGQPATAGGGSIAQAPAARAPGVILGPHRAGAVCGSRSSIGKGKGAGPAPFIDERHEDPVLGGASTELHRCRRRARSALVRSTFV